MHRPIDRRSAFSLRTLALASALALGPLPVSAGISTTGPIGTNPGGLILGPGNTDLGLGQVWVGGNADTSLQVDAGSQFSLGTLTFATQPGFRGTGLIDGAGTRVNLVGSGNRLEVGNWGPGSLTVSGGASLLGRDSPAACGGCYNFIGNAAGSTGELIVTGAGSSASLWSLVVAGAAVFGPPVDAFTFGTSGGLTRGSVQVLNGAYLESIVNTVGNGPGGSIPTGTERTFGSVRVAGAGSTWHVTSNLVNGVDASVQLATHRNATAAMEVSGGGQLLLDAVPGRFSTMAVGQFGRADMVVSGGGQVLYGAGASGALQIGRNAGAQGSLQVLAGGVVDGGFYYSAVGRDGGTGTLTVDGAGALFRMAGDTTLAASGGAASFVASLDVGRNGGTGTANVRNGGRIEIIATTARSTSPSIGLGRDAGAVGTLNISGVGSTVYLSAASTLPGGGAAEARNPLLRVGALGTGVLNITAGGLLRMDGNAVSTVAASRSTVLFVGGVGDTASGGTGVALVSGANSMITQTGSDNFIGVGIGAGASGVLTVANQGAVNGMIINLGRSGGVGVLNLDNGMLNLAGQQTGNSLSGAGLAVGSGGGSGVFNLSNGGLLTINNAGGTVSAGVNLGGTATFPGGQGIVTMGSGSRIDISAPAGLGGIAVGRSGIGSLRMSASHIDTHGNGGVVIARDSGSVGTLLMSDSSTLKTDFVGVGRNRGGDGVVTNGGIATLVVNSGSSVTANQIEIGPQGYLGGDGTVVGNVVNFGVLNPGNSPGTLVIDGSFANAAGGRIVLEVASDGAGGFVTDRLVFAAGTAVDLAGAQIGFSFLGSTDPNAFQASGGFGTDSFFQAQDGAGGTVGLAPGLFSAASFSAQSSAYQISNFSFDAAAGANFTAVPVPEPATTAMLLAGLASLGGWARRRRQA